MKKILIICLISLIIFIIYLGLQDKKIYYVNIGDNYAAMPNNYNEYITNYLEKINKLEKFVNISNNDYRVTDIINDINLNKVIDNKSFKNILIKADVLILSIGYSDITNKLTNYNNNELYNYMNGYIIDVDKLFKLLRKYTKEDIILLNNFSIIDDTKNSINEINKQLKDLTEKYNIYYVDISNIEVHDGYPTLNGTNDIYLKIKNIIDNNVL